MKQAIFLTAFIAVATFGHARAHTGVNNLDSTLITGDGDSVLLRIPPPQELLKEIVDVTGLQMDFELKEADVMNIQASISHHNREILYNPSYITWINKLTRDKWCTMALIAHEVGHHLNGHTIRKGGSSPAVELEADEFAGFILFKLGATLEDAQKVMNYIAGVNASDTHPGRADRKEAIKKGWEKASGNLNIAATNK